MCENKSREGILPGILFCDDRYLELQIDPKFKSGGATRQVAAWIQALKSIGMPVKVLGAHSAPEKFWGRGDTIVSYNPNRGIPKFRYIYIRIPGLISGLRRAGTEYVYYGVPSSYAGVLALCVKCLRKKFVLRVSNDLFVDNRAWRLFDPFRYFWFVLGFRLADRILCQNGYQVSHLANRYPGKVHKISNPFFGRIADRPAAFHQRKYVVWVGIFQYQKNLPLLVEIARRLPEVPFRVLGEESKDLGEGDRRAVKILRELPNVTLAGFVDRSGVLETLGDAFLLLNTSHNEGFSNTYLEAFSCGTPVVSPSQNDPDGIVQERGLGKVYMDGDEAAAAIRTLLADGETFRELSGNCTRYMKEHHDPRKQAMELIEVIGHAPDKM